MVSSDRGLSGLCLMLMNTNESGSRDAPERDVGSARYSIEVSSVYGN